MTPTKTPRYARLVGRAVALWAAASATTAFAQANNRLPNWNNTSRVAAGKTHVVVIGNGDLQENSTTTEIVSGWGSNASGELGDGTTTQRTIPTLAFQGGVVIAAGDSFSMMVGNDGFLYAWGKNGNGQLGDGSTTNRNSPERTAYQLDDYRFVACGNAHTLAIQSDGSMWAFGANAQGQLGIGNTTQQTSPQVVGSSSDAWLTAAGGNQFSLGIKTDGTLWSWGYNTSGQLGFGNTTSPQKTPKQIGTSHWLKVAAGTSHALAIRDDGTLWAWGLNDKGQLGNGNTTNQSSPVQITSTSGPWIEITAGDHFSAAIKADGSLWAWGDNSSGQLGIGSTTNQSAPKQVGTFRGWQSVNAGLSFLVAVKADGMLYTWGNNSNGQLANGSTTSTTAAGNARFAGAKRTILAAGGSTAGNVRSTGWIETWGDNSVGELGQGTVDGNAHEDSTVMGTGTLWKALAFGRSQGLAVRGDGTLWGWGGNANGEVGNGTTTLKSSPVQIGTDSKWVAVAASASHSFGLKADGTLWGWGENYDSQLGEGTQNQHNSPVQIGSSHKWVAISTNWYHTIALASNGTLWTWGDNTYGELGNGTSSPTLQATPAQIGSNTYVAVAADNISSFAVAGNGFRWAWGWNSEGELGDGSKTGIVASPEGPLDGDYVDICSGVNSSLGRKPYLIGAGNTVIGWGANSWGELGFGAGNTNETPTPTASQLTGIALACGNGFTIASSGTGTRLSVGVDDVGEMGGPSVGVGQYIGMEDNMELYDVDTRLNCTFNPTSCPGWLPSANTGTPANGLDGNWSTHWTTNAPQAASGQWFELDLTQGDPNRPVPTFSQVLLDSGTAWPNDYPRTFKVETSNNGTTWTQATTGTGDFRVVHISFPPVTARFVRVSLTAAFAGNYWSIAEADVQF
jgi:alpha-tubulin suppressor-like RCC1 family protein